jgi:hypothetical protein
MLGMGYSQYAISKNKTLKSQNLTLKIKPQNPNPRKQILKSQTT